MRGETGRVRGNGRHRDTEILKRPRLSPLPEGEEVLRQRPAQRSPWNVRGTAFYQHSTLNHRLSPELTPPLHSEDDDSVTDADKLLDPGCVPVSQTDATVTGGSADCFGIVSAMDADTWLIQ